MLAISVLSEFIKTYAPAVGWLIVVIGWSRSHRENNEREDRHELRKTIDSITEDITALENKAYEYYATEINLAGPEPITDEAAKLQNEVIKLQVDILRYQGVIISRIQRLRQWNEVFRDQSRLFEFRTALTGGDFETAERRKRRADDPKLQEISWAAKELIDSLEAGYAQIYKPSRTPKPATPVASQIKGYVERKKRARAASIKPRPPK